MSDRTGNLKMPTHMHFNLTQRCNIKCRICRPDDEKNNSLPSLSKEVIDKVINEVFDHLKQLRMDSSGELLISKHLPYVLEEATKRNLPIFASSNGMALNEEKAELLCNSSLETIQISLDSPEKETLEWIRRGAKFEKVLKAAENLVAARTKAGKKFPKIDFHAALIKQNLEQLPDLVRLAKKTGIESVGVAYGYTHAIMDPEWSVYWVKDKCNSVIAESQRVAQELGIFFNNPASFNSKTEIIATPTRYCNYLYEWSYIDPSGRVFPCCIGNYETGDLNKSSFSDIWNGEKYNELRRTYNTSAPSYAKCSSCYITSVWNPEDYKVHFHPDHWEYVEKKLKTLPETKYESCVYGEYVFPGEFSNQLKEIMKAQEEGDINEAVKKIEQAIYEYPDVANIYNLYAVIIYSMGDSNKAKSILKSLLVRWPSDCLAANNLAVLKIQDEEYQEALHILKHALTIDQNNKSTHENLKLLREQLEEAERERSYVS